MILYIETNFIVGAALGRDPLFEELLATDSARVNIYLPDVCVFEAVAVLEGRKRERNKFSGDLRATANELRRHPYSTVALDLAAHLENADIANANLEEDIGRRFRQVLQSIEGAGSSRIRLLPLDWEAMHLWESSRPLRDATDNLILKIICSHASRVRAVQARNVPKALLTSNTKDFDDMVARHQLDRSGIERFYSTTDRFMHWYRNTDPSEF